MCLNFLLKMFAYFFVFFWTLNEEIRQEIDAMPKTNVWMIPLTKQSSPDDSANLPTAKMLLKIYLLIQVFCSCNYLNNNTLILAKRGDI